MALFRRTDFVLIETKPFEGEKSLRLKFSQSDKGSVKGWFVSREHVL